MDEPTRPLELSSLHNPERTLDGDTQPLDLANGLALAANEPLQQEVEPEPESEYQPRSGRRQSRSHAEPVHMRFSKSVVALAVMLGVLVVTGAGLFAYASQLLGSMRYDPSKDMSGYADATPEPDQTADPSETLLDETALDNALAAQTAAPIVLGKSTYNILLLGLDTRDASSFDSARSDVMMLVTMDTDKKTIKLTSFMRDIIVDIPGHSRNRLNTAFVFGGPDLTKQMLSQYFGIKVDNYGIINFWAFASVIDALGGVNVDVKSAELENMNKNIDEINRLSKKKTAKMRSGGEQKLSGGQAIAYMRIRHGDAGGGDFERTQRQRTVMNNLTKKLKNMTLPQGVELLNTLQPFVRTDMNQAKMLEVVTKLLSMGGAQVQELRIPADGAYRQGSVNNVGKGVLLLDFPKNVSALQDFLEK
jgi:LCP family protein required for cell wall assembly